MAVSRREAWIESRVSVTRGRCTWPGGLLLMLALALAPALAAYAKAPRTTTAACAGRRTGSDASPQAEWAGHEAEVRIAVSLLTPPAVRFETGSDPSDSVKKPARVSRTIATETPIVQQQPLGPIDVGTDFEALPDNNTFIPPSPNGVAGPNHLMVMANTEVLIQDKTGATVSGPLSLTNWWTSGTGLSGTPIQPRVLYDDADAGRWHACAREFSGATSKVFYAISDTSDPTGSWSFYEFDADATDTDFASFPGMGFNQTWVAIAVNMFPVGGGLFQGAKMWVIDKSTALIPGGPLTMTEFPLGFDAPSGANGFAYQPCVTFGAESTLYLLDNANFTDGGGTQLMRLSQITGTGASPSWSVVPGSVFGGTGLFTVGTNFAYNQITAAQSGTAARIDTLDARLSASVIFRNGSLWACHSGGLPVGAVDRTATFWYEIDPAAMPSPIVQSGVLDGGADVHHYFPSLNVNAAEDVCVGFSRSSASLFNEAAFAHRLGTDTAGTIGPIQVLKVGEDSYEKDFGGGSIRWGDYSSMSVDPSDDTSFWYLGDYAATDVGPNPNDDRWGTWWGKKGDDGGGSSAFAFGWGQNPVGNGSTTSSGGGNGGCGAGGAGGQCGGSGGETLEVGNVGAGGGDGNATMMGDTEGFQQNFQPLMLINDGNQLRVDVEGTVDDLPDSEIGHAGIRNNNGALEAFLSFNPIQTSDILVVLFLDGQEVASVPLSLGGGDLAATMTDGGAGMPGVTSNILTLDNGVPSIGLGLDRAADVTPVGSSTVSSDAILLTAVNPTATVTNIQDFETTAASVGSYTLTNQQAFLNGLYHAAVGNADLSVVNGQLVVTPAGVTDGMYVNLNRLDAFVPDPRQYRTYSLVLQPLTLPDDGNQFALSARATVDGVACEPFGTVTITSNGGILSVVSDFAPTGATLIDVQVFDGGVEGGSGQVANAATAAQLDDSSALVELITETDPPSMRLIFVDPTSITIPGSGTHTGNIVQVTANNPNKPVSDLSCFEVISDTQFRVTSEWTAEGVVDDGIEWTPIANADFIKLDDDLQVNNIGSSGDDGASGFLGQAQGWAIAYLQPVPLDVAGQSITVTDVGSPDGVNSVEICSLTMVNPFTENGGKDVEVDVSGFGTGQVDIEVFDGDTFVGTDTITIPSDNKVATVTDSGNGSPGPVQFAKTTNSSGDPQFIIRLDVVSNIDIVGGTQLQGDKIVFVPCNPTVEIKYHERVKNTGTSIGSATIGAGFIQQFDMFFTGLGTAKVTSADDPDHILLSNIDASGQSGVRIVTVDPTSDATAAPSGLQVNIFRIDFFGSGERAAFEGTGTLNGVPDSTLFSATLENDAGTGRASVDFTPLGSSDVIVQLRDSDGNLIPGQQAVKPASGEVATFAVGEFGASLTSLTPIVSGGSPELTFNFVAAVDVDLGSGAVPASQMRIVPVDPDVPVDGLAALDVTVRKQDDLVLMVQEDNRILAHGLEQNPFDDASLSVDASGNLIVDFGEEGGVKTVTGEAEGLLTKVDADLAPGESYGLLPLGKIDGLTNMVLSAIDVTNESGQTEIFVESGTIGATSLRVIGYTGEGENSTVKFELFPTGNDALFSFDDGGTGDQTIITSIEDNRLSFTFVPTSSSSVTISNQTFNNITRVKVIPVSPSVSSFGFVSESNLDSLTTDSVTITDQAILKDGRPVRAEGDAELEPRETPGGKEVGVNSLDSTGNSGFAVNLAPQTFNLENTHAQAGRVNLNDFDPAGISLSSTASVNGVPGSDVVIVSIIDNVSTYDVNASFQTNPTGILVEAIDQFGNVQGSDTLLPGSNPVAQYQTPVTINEFFVSVEEDQNNDEFIEICSDSDQTITFTGLESTFQARCLRCTGVGGSLPAEDLEGMELLLDPLIPLTVEEIDAGLMGPINIFGRDHTALPGSDTLLCVHDDKLEVCTGNGGGVSIDYKPEDVIEEGVKVLIQGETVNEGETAVVGAGGKEGNDNVFLGFGQVQGTADDIEISANWDPATSAETLGERYGADQVRVLLCKDGEVVGPPEGMVYNSTETVGTLPTGTFMTGLGTLGTKDGTFGYRINVEDCAPFTFEPGGPTVEVDEIKLIAHDSTTMMDFDASVLTELTNVDLQGINYCYLICDEVMGDPEVFYAGLEHRPVNNGVVESTPGSLKVSDFDGTGQNGGETYLRDVTGFSLELDPDDFNPAANPTGDAIQAEAKSFERLDADFNNDGGVDTSDFTVWKDNLGLLQDATQDQGDADGDGDVDGNDYNLWRSQLGAAAEQQCPGTFTATDVGNMFEASATWSDGGTSRVILYDVDGNPVADESGIGNPVFQSSGGLSGLSWETAAANGGTSAPGWLILHDFETSVTVPGRTTQNALVSLVVAEGSPELSNPIRLVKVTGTNLNELDVNDYAVEKSDVWTRTMGMNSRMYPTDGDRIIVDHIGSSGLDGVIQRPNNPGGVPGNGMNRQAYTTMIEVKYAGLESTGTEPVVVSVEGLVNDTATAVGSARAGRNGADLALSANFNGATHVQARLFDGSIETDSAVVAADALAASILNLVADDTAVWSYRVDAQGDSGDPVVCYELDQVMSCQAFGGSVVNCDRVCLEPSAGPGTGVVPTVTDLTSISHTAADIESFVLTGAQFIPVVPGDCDGDGDVDLDDLSMFEACASGPGVPVESGCEDKDLDGDGDADHEDFSIIQGCFSGADNPADPICAD